MSEYPQLTTRRLVKVMGAEFAQELLRETQAVEAACAVGVIGDIDGFPAPRSARWSGVVADQLPHQLHQLHLGLHRQPAHGQIRQRIVARIVTIELPNAELQAVSPSHGSTSAREGGMWLALFRPR